MEKIMPCPFCGYYFPKLQKDGVCDFYWYVQCTMCGARKNSQQTEEEAIKDWNKRS